MVFACPEMYWSWKSQSSRSAFHLACLEVRFCGDLKYFKLLWSHLTSIVCCAPQRRYLNALNASTIASSSLSLISQFSSAEVNDLEWKATRSSVSPYSCCRIDPTAYADASVSRTNHLLWSGLRRTGQVVNACLRMLNAICCIGPQCHCCPLHVRSCRGLATSEQCRMNALQKLPNPRKLRTSFRSIGFFQHLIASTFIGSI